MYAINKAGFVGLKWDISSSLIIILLLEANNWKQLSKQCDETVL
jgi:hypothetical protein